jgi:hypothetical protein
MAVSAAREQPSFDAATFDTFRFLGRNIEPDGLVRLRYGLDDRFVFEERFQLPSVTTDVDTPAVQGLLDLLHWTAGVSYYKLAAPPTVSLESGIPSAAGARMLEALYSEGLGEFAIVNGLARVPSPSFPSTPDAPMATAAEPERVLVPVGGGKDSAVAIEIVRRSGLEFVLFSVGDAAPIARTAQAARAPRMIVTRRLDPQIGELNRQGALNGHVPITAIVSLVAALTAAVNGFDTVALANERSASAANMTLDGVAINHQFSKSWHAEQLLGAAVAQTGAGVSVVSVLRPASELSIARCFAGLPQYHDAFTSCNRSFRLDPAERATSWCTDCDKCRFVFLILALFLDPETMVRIFGRSMLDDETQIEDFALLTGTGGHKPFECVGEIAEAVAAIRLLATASAGGSADPRWSETPVVRALAAEVLPRFGPADARLQELLALSDEHAVPDRLIDSVRALLGA